MSENTCRALVPYRNPEPQFFVQPSKICMPTSRWREVRYCDWQKGERYISDIIIPKFHAMSHQSRCQLLLYNSCCPLLAAQINGEGPERLWAAVRENTSRLWPLRAKL
ncbi:hypothetical protein DFH08DRAFT_1089706 [Mycena albidolilacea]|uniref:Uncharacterized protein n=1 Tax=Mycena albidolilacea TaxID=1033008 RepID=A0AAD6YZY3_9AGAR|nr:hypothetical protein DFH08DRAFT_1089706 [Mycena albidolilacea]